MIVGGINLDGSLWSRSKVDPPNEVDVIKVYAPCHDITIPNAITGGYRAPAEVEGVSYGMYYHSNQKLCLRRIHSPLTDLYYTSCWNNYWTWCILLRAFKSFKFSSRRYPDEKSPETKGGATNRQLHT